MKKAVILTCAFVLAACMPALGDKAAPCQVHVILFVPSDANTPKDHQTRIDQIVGYAEAFFTRELKRWGHKGFVMPFRRSPDGHVEVAIVRGKQANTGYKPVAVRAEVLDALKKQGKLEGGRQIWWIMVYTGEPPAKPAGFLGGFGVNIGGWSVCNFPATPGVIDPAAPLGSPFLEQLMLKGMLHELGHGFQLPHIGPLNHDNAGNTLMGPTHLNYRRVVREPGPDVYLSEAEAAMFSTHPAFRGLSDERKPLPGIRVLGLNYTANFDETAIIVSGRVVAERPAVYAFVADEADSRPGEYWTKTYTAKVDRDGAFKVTITEPSESNGTLKIWFGFDNGSQTGNGKTRGRDSGIPKAYGYDGRRWSLK